MNDTNFTEPLTDADFSELLIRHMLLSPEVSNKAKQLNIVGDDLVLDDTYGNQVYKELVNIINSIDVRPVPANTLLDGLKHKFEDGTLIDSLKDNTLELFEYFYNADRLLESPEFFDSRLLPFLKNRRAQKLINKYRDDVHTLTSELNKLNLDLAGDSPMSRPRVMNPFSSIIFKTKSSMIGTGLSKLDEKLDGGLLSSEYAMLLGFSGGGKCHGKGTKILMYDGSIKNVEDIKVGELLMGNDSTSREVLSLARGSEQMYKVIPVKGEPWTCNESHILSLVCNTQCGFGYQYGKGNIVNMTVKDYCALIRTKKDCLKLYRIGVDYPVKPLNMDPYIFGCWIGDGTRAAPKITNTDPEIISAMMEWAKINKYKVRQYDITYCFSRKPEINIFRNEIKRANGNNQKRIPSDYLINSESNRLQLLAGIIDTDGYLHHNFYEVVTKYEGLSQDILYLARSLGFAAYSYPKIATMKREDGSIYRCKVYRVNISGHVNKIPCKVIRKRAGIRQQIKDVLHVGFTVEPINDRDYYGFELSGNHLYLLGDFTVTHNTAVGTNMVGISAEMGRKAVYISCEEHEDDLSQRFYSRVFRIPYRQLRQGSANIELESKFNEELTTEKIKFLKDNLCLMGLKGIDGAITPNLLYELLKQNYEETGFIPELVMLDQLQFITPDAPIRKNMQTYEIEGMTAAELDQLSHKQIGGKGFVLWVQHQAKGKTRAYFTIDEIQGYKAIVNKPDLVLGVGRAGDKSDEINLFPLKIRHSADFKITLKTEFEYMTVTSTLVTNDLPYQNSTMTEVDRTGIRPVTY
jgi:hypothetical protein